MSEEDTTKSNPLATILATINDLRTSNAKVFYGGIAAIAILFFFVFAIGPDGEDAIKSNLSVGQNYSVSNPNGGDIVLVAAPMMSSADYADEDSGNICILPSGTPITLKEKRTVNYIPFVKIQVVSGECSGKTGWTSAVNLG